jgi:signal transduction histidine kinase
MADRVRRSVEKNAFILCAAMIFVSMIGCVAMIAAFDMIALRRENADAAADIAPRVEEALRRGDAAGALRGVPSIRYAKLHAADGSLIAETPAPLPAREGLAARFASRFASSEIICSTLASGETFCSETSTAPVEYRLAWWLGVLAATAVAALALAIATALSLRRTIARAPSPMIEVVDRVVSERDYSQRIPPMSGALGSAAASVNSLIAQMQEREAALRKRTVDLEAVNKELESFAYAVSHDLRRPLGSIDGFTQALTEDYSESLDDTGREWLGWIREGCRQMKELIEGLLAMAALARAELELEPVDLSSIARSVAEGLRKQAPERQVRFEVVDGARVVGDPRLLRAVVENLMNNAFKFTRGRDEARIEFGVVKSGNEPAFYVRDNGAGFDASHASKMFRPFQRLHSSTEFEGTGIGLATVQKIISRHGGRAWAEGEVGKGATIFFTAGAQEVRP